MKKIIYAAGCIGLLVGVAFYFGKFKHVSKFEPFKHEARQIDFWKKYDFTEKSLEEKFFDIPDALLDYLNKDNANQGWPNRPVRAELPTGTKAQLIEALNELPESVKEEVKPLLGGIFFVKDLGGTAYSEYIVDRSGKPVAGFMVFDELILEKTANQWATWKEQSPFLMAHSPYKLNMIIEDGPGDNMKNAFQFIALHELGHIISINSGMHPPWGYGISQELHPSKYTFSKLSWSIQNDKDVSLFDKDFPLRPKIQFYRGGLEANLDEVYSALERTNFPTLYSATNPSDDFADSFAAFVHVVLLNKPYKVIIEKDNRVIKTADSCWSNERCLGKEKILKKFLDVQ